MTRQPTPLSQPEHLPPRYCKLDFPAYRHVPGLTPHPVRDSQGHSYSAEDPAPDPALETLPDGWRNCRDYLYGVDLFNRAYLWEAHEAWEIVWIGTGKTTYPGHLAQGLIQVSAGLLRLHLGTPGGAGNLLRRARGHLDVVESRLGSAGRSYMGVGIDSCETDHVVHATQAEGAFAYQRVG